MNLRTCPVTVRALVVVVAFSAWGCGSSGTSDFPPGGGPPNSQSDGAAPPPSLGPQPDGGTTPTQCTGLQCQVHACSSGSTTISGTIYDPAGHNPLYNVVAYVPNSTPQPFTSGASCTTCDALYTGNPIATALTDATGKFTIANAPDGTDIPLVLQIGKWRKQLKIPSVTACKDNPLPDKSLTLPKNQKEGDIPLIAISTGGSDTLECLLSRVGVDAAEYSPAGGAGRLQMFKGGAGYNGMFGVVPDTQPSAPQSYQSLWDAQADLMKYDIVLLSCEGEETKNTNQAALEAYAGAGGRVFASHFHYAWLDSGPFGAANLATWSTGSNNMPGTVNGNIVTTLPNGQPFPKGQAMLQWLGTVGALTNSELPIVQAKHNADVSASNTLSQPWIVADQNATPPNATQYFSFDTPLNATAANVCGRVVYSDLHVGGASSDNPQLPVPQDCTPGLLSPQEDALEFMLFDLSSCVTPNSQPPQPPPPQTK